MGPSFQICAPFAARHHAFTALGPAPAGLPPPPRRARRTHDAGGPGGPAASLHHGEERTTPAARPGRDERRRWFDQRRRARLRSLPLPGCGGCGHTFFGPAAGLRRGHGPGGARSFFPSLQRARGPRPTRRDLAPAASIDIRSPLLRRCTLVGAGPRQRRPALRGRQGRGARPESHATK